MSKFRFLSSIPFLVAVFAILYLALGLVYYNKHNESQDLSSQLSVVRNALGKPQPDLVSLQQRLSDASAKSDIIMTGLPRAEQGIDVYAALVALARSSNVTIQKIESARAITPKAGPTGRTSLPYTMTISGSHEDTVAFLNSMAQGSMLLQGLELRNVTIRTASNVSGDVTELEVYVHTWPNINQEMPTATPVAARGKK